MAAKRVARPTAAPQPRTVPLKDISITWTQPSYFGEAREVTLSGDELANALVGLAGYVGSRGAVARLGEEGLTEEIDGWACVLRALSTCDDAMDGAEYRAACSAISHRLTALVEVVNASMGAGQVKDATVTIGAPAPAEVTS